MGKHNLDSDRLPSETARRAKKRKRAEAVLDLPEGISEDSPSLSIDSPDITDVTNAENKDKKRKKDRISSNLKDNVVAEDGVSDIKGKKKKKRKQNTLKESEKALELSTPDGDSKISRTAESKSNAGGQAPETADTAKQSCDEKTESRPSGEKKKEKKNRKDKASKASKTANGDHSVATEKVQAKAEQGAGNQRQSDRFIVFIGNLPFTANKTSIEKHFESVRPDSVRHITHKDEPSKSKGYAFLEFSAFDRMKTCLKLFHHSQFEDGISEGRKINVELTAGGGGSKSKDRKTKLKVKNDRLNEQRQRRLLEEAKAKSSGKKKEEGHGGGSSEVVESGVHPSRRSRVF